MTRAVSDRQFRCAVLIAVGIALLSVVTSVSTLWAGYQWRQDRKSREAAVEAADRAILEVQRIRQLMTGGAGEAGEEAGS